MTNIPFPLRESLGASKVSIRINRPKTVNVLNFFCRHNELLSDYNEHTDIQHYNINGTYNNNIKTQQA